MTLVMRSGGLLEQTRRGLHAISRNEKWISVKVTSLDLLTIENTHSRGRFYFLGHIGVEISIGQWEP